MLHLNVSRLASYFNPGLPARAWLLQFGVLINFFGNGLVAPFLLIYLHFGRGIPIAFAASAVALGGITAVPSGLVAGALADRVGPRNTLALGMVCNAAAYLTYTQVTAAWEACCVGLMVGVGTGAYGPSAQNLLASLVPAGRRAAGFAQLRITSIAGLGSGGLVGGLIAAAGLVGEIRLLVLDAMTFLTFAAVTLLLPTGRVLNRVASGGYRLVVRDRPFMRLTAVNTSLIASGTAPMLVLLPAFAKGQAHLAEPAIGAIFALSSLTIVIAQLPVTRMSGGRNRMRVLRLGALLWVGAWLACFGAGAWLSGALAAAILAFAVIVYALGECLYTSVMLPTATALAPEALRGRYLGFMGLAWQTGYSLGPALGGVILGAAPLVLPLACAAGCAVGALGTSAVNSTLAPPSPREAVPASAA